MNWLFFAGLNEFVHGINHRLDDLRLDLPISGPQNMRVHHRIDVAKVFGRSAISDAEQLPVTVIRGRLEIFYAELGGDHGSNACGDFQNLEALGHAHSHELLAFFAISTANAAARCSSVYSGIREG